MSNVRLMSMGDSTEGQLMSESDTPTPTGNPYIWWFVALIVLHVISFINVQYTTISAQRFNAEIRQELNENATLIKQLQERQVVRELSKLKRSE